MNKRYIKRGLIVLFLLVIPILFTESNADPLEERTYVFWVDSHGFEFESSISAHNVGEARMELIENYYDLFGWDLEKNEIRFRGVRENHIPD
ncbi:hypothetical protein H8D36_01010 [archaeon]|nr:hypothetical protein [archaeon]